MGTDSFRDCVPGQLPALVSLRCKRIFGGQGLHSGAVFFGFVFDGRLYFKTNPGTLPDYLAFGAAVRSSSKKQVLQNYREVQANLIEDASKLTTRTQKAVRS